MQSKSMLVSIALVLTALLVSTTSARAAGCLMCVFGPYMTCCDNHMVPPLQRDFGPRARQAIKLGYVSDACMAECKEAGPAETIAACVNDCRAKECEKQVAGEPAGSHPVDFLEKCKSGLVAAEESPMR